MGRRKVNKERRRGKASCVDVLPFSFGDLMKYSVLLSMKQRHYILLCIIREKVIVNFFKVKIKSSEKLDISTMKLFNLIIKVSPFQCRPWSLTKW